jgi:hypothetical protein
MEKKLFVVLGDMVSSRNIVDRDNFENRIEKACDEVNQKYKNCLYSNFKTIKGIDEIGGVLKDISHIYKIIILLQDYFYPQSMRFALVFDCVNAGLETDDVSKMDGPAFHIAAEEINKLKKKKLLFGFRTKDEITDTAIEGEINLLLLLSHSLSDTQRRIIKEYRKSMTHKEIADTLGTTRQNVSNTLERIDWARVDYIENNLSYILHRYNKKITRWEQNDEFIDNQNSTDQR